MVLLGYIFAVGQWKKLSEIDKWLIKHECLKLEIIGYPIKHYHQMAIGNEITLIFSSNAMYGLCKGVGWDIQHSPEYIKELSKDSTALPREFLVMPRLSLKDLMELRYRIMMKGLEIHAFYNKKVLYKAEVLDSGQLLMRRCSGR